MNLEEVARQRTAPLAPAPAPADLAPQPSRLSRSGAVLALQARALCHERFHASATAVATELALMLGCERVSIGFLHRERARVGVVSNAADIREQQAIVRAIAAAMDEAIDQGAVIVHPLPGGSSPSVSLAHAELTRKNGNASICTVPIIGRGRGRGRMLGAIVFERRDGFDARAVEIAKDAATFVGPVLELKHRLDQPIGARIARAVAPRGEHAGPFQPAAWHVGLALVALSVLVAALWPSTFRVVAPARVEGEGQRIISAPVDGFVRSSALRPGAPVKAGQVLATLEDHELALEREKWNAESEQLDKQYREALTQDDAAQIVIARSKLEQAQVQLALVESQLDRAQLRAPFDGVLVSGDLSQSIGMPVARGQELMTVAPDKSFRIVAEVDEQDIGALREGQRARVMFGALSSHPVQITVTRIAPVAAPLDGRNVFEVDGRIEGSAEALRPGLRGVARIEIARQSLGWVWWHRTSDWMRRTMWRVLG
ncbi:MAG: HlyD family efflux transporter periplasmic adaptor subunit [Methylibium sp.]|nr:HlyD family efflux transporter periplasmic adaptor subunit [Methylibium sp.]MBA3623936.1 HlyD family efflux transporter periplasmic adaptor subunit [Methylibium sp.]